MRTSKFLVLLAFVVALSSCASYKRFNYFQDATPEAIIKTAAENEVRLKPHDRISVIVSSKDPELASPFNATSTYNSLASGSINTTSATGKTALQVRTIDELGMLEMPIIGRIYCTGKTRHELSREIAAMIVAGGYISDASVNVQFEDMKISVIGEVNRPGMFDVSRDKLTVLEALALAGDLSMYGNRSHVAVVRNVDNETKYYLMNLLDTSIFNSEAYYLQPGDVVYVQPNRYKAANSEISQNRSFWLSLTSTLVSVSTLALSIITLSRSTKK